MATSQKTVFGHMAGLLKATSVTNMRELGKVEGRVEDLDVDFIPRDERDELIVGLEIARNSVECVTLGGKREVVEKIQACIARITAMPKSPMQNNTRVGRYNVSSGSETGDMHTTRAARG